MESEKPKLKFKDAYDRLEEISNELSSDDKDVDELVEKVKEAADLIIQCKDILANAQTNIDKIIKDVESKTETTTETVEEVVPQRNTPKSSTSSDDDLPF